MNKERAAQEVGGFYNMNRTSQVGRRDILSRLALGGTALMGSASCADASGYAIKAAAFDGFAVFDPRPVFARVEEMFPGERGAALGNLWRIRQFEYTWLRTMSSRYSNFWQVTDDALIFAAKALKIDLTATMRAGLMQPYLNLQCWPEVPAALHSLKNAGIRLAILSNMTVEMVDAGIRNSELGGVFEHILSTDRVMAYKPDPRAYQLGLDSLRLKRHEVIFAAFAGWDMAGAKSFGYPTYWVNRQSQPMEELDMAPDAQGGNLKDLFLWLTSARQGRNRSV